jgi:hypothetical protein
MEQADEPLMVLIRNRLATSPKLITKDRREKRPNTKITHELRISSQIDIENLIKLLSDPTYVGLKGHKLRQYLT